MVLFTRAMHINVYATHEAGGEEIGGVVLQEEVLLLCHQHREQSVSPGSLQPLPPHSIGKVKDMTVKQSLYFF